MSENPREAYERRPEVRFARDMRLHQEVILSRQTDLVPLALAGDTAAQKELMGLSELSRSFSATARAVFAPVLNQQLVDRQRRAAEHANRPPMLPTGWTGTWALNEHQVLTPFIASHRR